MATDDWFDPPFDDVPREKRRTLPAVGCWLTKDGQSIKFSDMEHSHLLNTIAYLERQYRSLQDTFCDAALDVDLLYPSHAGLAAEARRRGLIPKTKKGMVTE